MIHLSPSILGLYFYYECPRYLVFRSTPSKLHKSRSIPWLDSSKSPVTRAIMKGGYLWEEAVVEKKLKSKVRVAKAEKGRKTRDKVFEVDETIANFRSMKDGEYLYQATLQAPDSFYEDFNMDKNKEVLINNCRPDLIYCRESDGKKIFEVIDLKASDHMKTSHKIQVGFYSLLLSHVLKEHNIQADVNTEEGGVWLYDQDEPYRFDMKTILPHIEEFLRSELKKINSKKISELDWHLYYRCESCEYFTHCRKEACDTSSVSLIPYLTVQGRKFLRHKQIGCSTLKEFEKFLKKKDAEIILSRSASLNGRTERLKNQVKALTNNEIIPIGSSSSVMPLIEKIRYILVAESDPVTGEIYLLGYKRYGGKNLFGTPQEEEIFIAGSADECFKIRAAFIKALHGSLSRIHDYNNEYDEWNEQISVQSYVFDTYSIELINETLLTALESKKTAPKALDLLFHYQNENLITADDHPSGESTFPIVVLTTAIRELFAAPIPVAFNLSSIFNAFKKDSCTYNYAGSSYFDFELGSQLKSDAIFSVWTEGNTKNLESIRMEVRKRIGAIHEIIWGIREKAVDNNGNSILFAYPPRFFFPDSDGYSNKVLSKLSFITKYEKLLEFMEIKQSRTLTKKERQNSGLLFSLEAIFDGGNEFVCQPTDYEHVLENSFGWLLSLDTLEGDRAQMAYNDYYYRNKPYVSPKSPVWHANIEEVNPGENGRLYVTLDLRRGNSSPSITKGKKYLLQRRFCDFISERVTNHLRKMDTAEYRHVPQLLENPMKYLQEYDADKKLTKLPSILKLTPSQKSALMHFIKHNLTLVWGPPGTGKTHFIAQTVLLILEYYRRINQPCNIFITAFTHAAIENCLFKLLEINRAENIWKDTDYIYKLGGISMDKFSGLESLDGDYLHSVTQNGSRSVIGGTVYALAKILKKSDLKFDVIIIDEASQLRAAESLIPVSTLNNKAGRLLIVGDDKQLPPIVKGVYPEPDEDELPLHRSIFEVIRRGDPDDLITCQLTENFRMNSALCRYPAEKIYGENYKSYNKEIAGRQIALKKKSQNDIINKMLNPVYPLVVCILEGGMTGSESEVEAHLVAMLSNELRQNLVNSETGKVYEDTIKGDKQFWRNGLSIVSPHHSQINLIKDYLQDEKLREPYFVDTVDKMQGQECDTVIVSYGVSDPEQATLEGEFIYSLNRLNVSLTRARAKSIVFIPRALLRPTLQVLENEDMADGITYMLGLEKFVEDGVKYEGTLKGHSDVNFTIFCKN